jgi:hypothetical protein
MAMIPKRVFLFMIFSKGGSLTGGQEWAELYRTD